MSDLEDLTIERELFAMRAVPAMVLDVDDMFARAARAPERSARARAPWQAWVGAAACAAAALFGPVRAPSTVRDAVVDARGGVSDGLSCRSDVAESNAVVDGDSMCVAPTSLVCERDVTFSIEKP